ncbi:MAG TPA: 2-dehydropantoate 2-reductase, partial [Chloroflexota bacterium]|nr:2-dehydropantoate 2-reductase [Chloroflexota bacterium]
GMRVLIVGAGALGTCYASLLARAGVEVAVLVRPERIETMPSRLRVSGIVEAEERVRVTASGREVGAVDYLVLSTKSRDTAGALEHARGVEPETALSLQNGPEKNTGLVQHFGAGRVIGAACAVGASVIEPGHARLTMNRATWLGELAGGTSERVVRLVAVLRAAGFPSWSVPDIRAVEWYKLCALLPGALVTALSRRPYDEMALHPDLADLFVQIMRETFAVPQAAGVAIGTDPPGSPWQFAAWLRAPDEVALAGLRAIGEQMRAAGQTVQPSLMQDILARRGTEAEDMVGGLIPEAHRLGVQLPATETCYRLVRGLQRRGS